jgi:hypothetical protein
LSEHLAYPSDHIPHSAAYHEASDNNTSHKLDVGTSWRRARYRARTVYHLPSAPRKAGTCRPTLVASQLLGVSVRRAGHLLLGPLPGLGQGLLALTSIPCQRLSVYESSPRCVCGDVTRIVCFSARPLPYRVSFNSYGPFTPHDPHRQARMRSGSTAAPT